MYGKATFGFGKSTMIVQMPQIPAIVLLLLSVLQSTVSARFVVSGPVLTVTLKDPDASSEPSKWLDLGSLHPNASWSIQSKGAPLPAWFPSLKGIRGSLNYRYEDSPLLPSDVSADDLVDAIFEGRLEDADRYAATYGASLGSGRGSLSLVLQHIARLEGMAAQVSLGSSIDGVVSAPRYGIFFKRRASVAHQLRIWDTESLLGAGEKVCGAILQTRQYADLGEAIESRAILALSRVARARQSSAK